MTTIVTFDLDAIISEINVAAPAERVFAALTDPKQLVKWFTDASCPVKSWEMDARRGGRYAYATAKGTVVVNGVSEFECHGEILEIRSATAAGLYLDRQLAYRQAAKDHRALGVDTERRWHACEGHPQRPGPGSGCARGLPRRLARGGGKTERIRGEIERRISSAKQI